MRRKKNERKRERERDGKASVPASFCSSFVIATWTLSSTSRRNLTTAATEIQSLLIVHCISVKSSLFSVGRRHDFKEVRDLKASSFLVRPITTYRHTHNNIDTSCSLVSDSFLCKETKISVRLQRGPCVHIRTNRNRSFSVLKKRRRRRKRRKR